MSELNRDKLIGDVAQKITDDCDINDILAYFKSDQENFLMEMDDTDLIEYIKEYDLATVGDYYD